jgi:hypothetical protein
MPLSSMLFALLQPDSEAQPVPHGLVKVPGMLMHPGHSLELSVHLQAVAMRSCWSASLLHRSFSLLGASSPYDHWYSLE